MGYNKDKDGTIRFPETKNKKEFNKQLEQFEELAKKGEILCITDLMINAENIHQNEDI